MRKVGIFSVAVERGIFRILLFILISRLNMKAGNLKVLLKLAPISSLKEQRLSSNSKPSERSLPYSAVSKSVSSLSWAKAPKASYL